MLPGSDATYEARTRAFAAALLARLPGSALGAAQLTPLAPAALSPPSAALLAHDRHMTAVLEACCGGRIAVDVRERAWDGERYARESLLRAPAGHSVQYAIVDVALARCPAPVRAEVLAERIPLGRALLPLSAALRIEVVGYVGIATPSRLAAWFGCAERARSYGRLVRIRLARDTVIKGLEVLSPTFVAAVDGAPPLPAVPKRRC